MKASTRYILVLIAIFVISAAATIELKQRLFPEDNLKSSSPISNNQQEKPLPLLKYTIPNLKNYSYQASSIQIDQIKQETDQFLSAVFTYETTGKTMSGLITVPKMTQEEAKSKRLPIIIMLRGWVPENIYQPGVGTSRAGQVFAQNGFVTVAPDFLGYGLSDPEPENSWEARFIKPINVIELIKTLQSQPNITIEGGDDEFVYRLNNEQIGMWGHSNGGQIAVTVLEAASQPIPTTLWAPVTAPFPYSILFFSDEHRDEGKEMRAWLAKFEQDYDVLEFSLTQHLDFLTGPLQLHHGTGDEAALKIWSDEFQNKINQENERRKQAANQQADSTSSTQLSNPSPPPSSALSQRFINTEPPQSPIKLNYYTYTGADHNLQPSQYWDLAVQRDLNFFNHYWQSQ